MTLSDEKKIIIAVDGYSSCGKSTVAKEIARQLNYVFIDSGAMYRAVTLFCLRNGLIVDGAVNLPALQDKLSSISVSFIYNPATSHNDVCLNGGNVEQEIRQLAVAQHVSQVAAIAGVRQLLVAQQQEMGRSKGIVMDGRDIGTVVFPEAELKIFMTADTRIRALRRYDEMIAKNEPVNFEEILKNITERDRYDETRAESPLRRAKDAIVLDNSIMTREEQFKWVLEKVEERIKKL
ncbi:MAG: (d)CMP kinase [Bacteroidetes bacterium]|nr:(d)CMP kinase [Bacteroidota bacterium]MCL6101590.1 (d)CMP kinase [Bacteroidota bacterium]